MSDFFSAITSAEGKVKYQQYNVKLLTEQFSVLVPFASRHGFYDEITANKPATKQEVINTLLKFNGRLEED